MNKTHRKTWIKNRFCSEKVCYRIWGTHH